MLVMVWELTNERTNQPTTWKIIHFLKLTVPHPVKFHTLYGPSRFITVATTAPKLSVSWAVLIQLLPHYISLIPILISYSHLRLCLPSGLFLSDSPAGLPHTCYIARESQSLIWSPKQYFFFLLMSVTSDMSIIKHIKTSGCFKCSLEISFGQRIY